MSDKLKPCPFCGGPAERVDIEDGENAGGSCICCTRCMASGNVEFEFKENFIDNWNRRSASPPAIGEPSDWSPEISQAAGRILAHLGFSTEASLDPGVDRRRDAVARIIESVRSPAIGEPVAGWVMVPRDWTIEMSTAFSETFYSKKRYSDDYDISDWYVAMLAAAPQAPATDAVEALKVDTREELMSRVWDAYWEDAPGGTESALQRVVGVVIAAALTGGPRVDEIDVTGWGVSAGHAIPVAVARYIAGKINERFSASPQKD